MLVFKGLRSRPRGLAGGHRLSSLAYRINNLFRTIYVRAEVRGAEYRVSNRLTLNQILGPRINTIRSSKMSIVALISLWAEAAKVHLGNLTTRRLNGAVDLFKAVKTAVALWTEHSGEITGASSGEYFGKVAEIAVESSQKIQKLRNIVWMSAAEYKELVAATGTQIVLDLGQDSRMSENIADYTTGFIVRSVIGANRSSDYRLTQTDAQEFMTLIKGHIKLSEYDTLVKNFGSLSKLCDALGTGKLWNHKYFAADPKDAKKDDDPPKKVETI